MTGHACSCAACSRCSDHRPGRGQANKHTREFGMESIVRNRLLFFAAPARAQPPIKARRQPGLMRPRRAPPSLRPFSPTRYPAVPYGPLTPA